MKDSSKPLISNHHDTCVMIRCSYARTVSRTQSPLISMLNHTYLGSSFPLLGWLKVSPTTAEWMSLLGSCVSGPAQNRRACAMLADLSDSPTHLAPPTMNIDYTLNFVSNQFVMYLTPGSTHNISNSRFAAIFAVAPLRSNNGFTCIR